MDYSKNSMTGLGLTRLITNFPLILWACNIHVGTIPTHRDIS